MFPVCHWCSVWHFQNIGQGWRLELGGFHVNSSSAHVPLHPAAKYAALSTVCPYGAAVYRQCSTCARLQGSRCYLITTASFTASVCSSTTTHIQYSIQTRPALLHCCSTTATTVMTTAPPSTCIYCCKKNLQCVTEQLGNANVQEFKNSHESRHTRGALQDLAMSEGKRAAGATFSLTEHAACINLSMKQYEALLQQPDYPMHSHTQITTSHAGACCTSCQRSSDCCGTAQHTQLQTKSAHAALHFCCAQFSLCSGQRVSVPTLL